MARLVNERFKEPEAPSTWPVPPAPDHPAKDMQKSFQPISAHRRCETTTRRSFLRTAALPLSAMAFPGLAARAAVAPPPWQMRLAFSSVMLAERPIEEVCERAAKLGFEAIDIWSPFDRCKHLADVSQRLGPEGLKELLEHHRLALASFTTYGSKTDSGRFPQFADFIAKSGGGIVVRESQYIDSPPENLTAAMRAFFGNLKPQIELAAASKVRLAIENHSGALLNSPDSFKAFLDLNPAPQHVGIGIAPYHLQGIKAPVDEIIRLVGNQLLFFYAWQTGQGIRQFPGHGPLDFVPILKALADIRYAGFVNPFMHGNLEPDDLANAITESRNHLIDCHREPTQR